MMYSLVPEVEPDGVEGGAEKLESHVTPIPTATVPAEEKVPSHLHHQELVLRTVKGKAVLSSELVSESGGWERGKCGLILVEGAPGIGKTTLAHKFCRQWYCCATVDLVKCRNVADINVQLEGDFSHDSCVIIMDSFDYFMVKRPKSLKGFSSLLKSKVADGVVFIMTRPIGVEHLYKNFEVEQHYCIEGFSPTSCHDYFRSIEPGKYSLICALLNQHEKCLQGLCCNPWACSKLVGILQSKKIHALNLTVTKIVYEIVLGVINREFQRDGVSPVTSLYSLSTELDILCKLALADLMNGSNLDSLDSCSAFLSSFSLENSIASLDEVTTLGLLSHCACNSHYASIKGRLYWFLSLEIRDFLAAFALHLLPPLDLLYLLSEHAQSLLKNEAYHGWLEFFYGLTVQRIEAQNPIHMMIATLNDLLVYSLDLEESGQMMVFIGCLWETEQPTLWKKLASKSCSFLRMSFLEEEVGKITPGLVNLITFSGFESWVIELGKGSEAGVNLMAYVATVDIEVKEDPSLEGVVRIWPKGLKTPKSRSSDQTTDFSTTIEQKLSKIGVFFCRAIREILQRVLQLYTSLKLKGDCSSLSFVSFLSCECFQKAVDGRITFEPIVPSHFLTIESASSKVGRKGGELIQHFREIHNDEAIELVILLRPCLKMVRFLLPSSQDNVLEIRLSGSYMPDNIYELFTSTFLLELEEVVHCAVAQESFPMKTEKVLPKLPECTVGTVSPAISLPPANPTPAGETEEDPSSLLSPPPTSSDPPPPTKTEEQLSPATLPPSSNLLPPIAMEPTTIEGQGPQDTYADSAFESTGGPLHQPVSSIPSLQPSNLPPIVTVDENTSTTPKGHSSSSHKTDNSTASTVGPLHQRPSIHNFSLQASSEPKLSTSLGVKLPHIQSRPASHLSSLQFPLVQPIQQSGRKLTSLRAGTVLYSNEPLIPTNHVIELPKEDNLIQSGGNGQIFAGIIAGLDVAVKKTSYRSKEYGIVTLIKHKNIVPLLAFVWGEENPAHRRRYFCYHVMARVTGDLARMATDKKEFMLTSLHLSYQHDPLKMSTITTNTRYILSSVLQGLSYLHNLNIAHRDIKASNVLLKFDCSCDNPLLCPCEMKYNVYLCDYDAAVQLDHNGQLPPTALHSLQAIAPQYHCVPVGTNGFRAPECSIHTTANSPDAFSPPIGTPCDVFSFGTLCLRMMLGEEGPYRQRVLAMLLLNYHQTQRYVEGRWRKGREQRVSTATVEKILKLTKVRREMGWLNYAPELVECCLKLNPVDRLTAKQLLDHSFFTATSTPHHIVSTPHH